MSLLPNLFASRSRTAILLALVDRASGSNLSELAELTRSSLCSTQSTLRQLHRERRVRLTRKGKETLYALNVQHPDAELLRAIAQSAEHLEIRRRASKYSASAQRTLQFASDTAAFLSSVRRLNDNS